MDKSQNGEKRHDTTDMKKTTHMEEQRQDRTVPRQAPRRPIAQEGDLNIELHKIQFEMTMQL